MLSLEEAQARIVEAVTPCEATEKVPLAAALGRFTAEPLHARVDNPAFDNSAMDGYALRTADLAARGGRLPLAGESRCGDPPASLAPATAMRIFTGAPLPAGADAVVMQEEVETAGGGEISIPPTVRPGDHIRRRGEDFRAGERLYGAGHRLRVYDLALLAAAGVDEVLAYVPARALVVASGDELVPPGGPLAPGQVYESNRLATVLQLRQLGLEVEDGGIVRDDPAALRSLVAGAADRYDFIVASGGASVGDYDLVRQVFAELGTIAFWKVRIKPGKPVAFGRVGRRTHFFALPGNPVSSLVTYKMFVEPALYAWHHARWRLPAWPAVAARDFRRRPGRTEFLRARLYAEGGRLYAEALPGQGSHMLRPLAHTNAFIRVEADSSGFAQGEPVTVVPLHFSAESV